MFKILRPETKRSFDDQVEANVRNLWRTAPFNVAKLSDELSKVVKC